MAKLKDELIKQQEEARKYFEDTQNKKAEKDKELDEIQNELIAVRNREDELMRKEEHILEDLRNLNQEVSTDEKRLADVDKLFTEARENDADWDYDNDKQ